MALDRLQMVTEICDIVGKSVGASSVSGATLKTRVENYYLNWAQRRIANHYSFYDLQQVKENAATVADVKLYPLESGDNNLGLSRVASINSIRLIDDNSSRKLTFWHYRKFDQAYPYPEKFLTGKSTIYTRWKNTLTFFKIPDDAYTLKIRYGQHATPFTSDGQVSDFGEDKDELLVTAGVLQTYLALQEYGDAKVWYELFLGQLVDAVRAEGDEDWEPQAEPYGKGGYTSAEPWVDPYGASGDPLYGYSE